MRNYWEQTENKGDLERGMFVILPLRYEETAGFGNLSVAGEEISFASGDFIELMNRKCRADGDFVRRFRMDVRIEPIRMKADILVTDLQLFVFYNGVAFLTAYLSYRNQDVDSVYEFVYPGYLSETEEVKAKQHAFLKELEEKILHQSSPRFHWFMAEDGDGSVVLKEAYRLNAAYAPKRFESTEILNRITYNEHRIIELSRDFEDSSEEDVAYVTGAKDVNSEDYGWGCCVTSQEISLVYAQGNVPLASRAEDDLLLTMLAIWQKYSCLMLNEEIHQRHMPERGKSGFRKSIQELKWEALEFIAYGTLEPSQISRWNNVCEMYRLLIQMNGVEESIGEIKEKIGLLNEEQERLDARRESSIGMIIAVFGLISIIGAVLQTVDYLATGRVEMIVSFVLSCAGIAAFGAALAGMYWRRKKRKGDV